MRSRQKHTTLRFKDSFRKCFIAYPVGEVQKEKKPDNYASNLHSATSGARSSNTSFSLSCSLVFLSSVFSTGQLPSFGHCAHSCWLLINEQDQRRRWKLYLLQEENGLLEFFLFAFAFGTMVKLRKDWWVVVYRTNGLVAPAAFILDSQVLGMFCILRIRVLKRYGISKG